MRRVVPMLFALFPLATVLSAYVVAP